MMWIFQQLWTWHKAVFFFLSLLPFHDALFPFLSNYLMTALCGRLVSSTLNCFTTERRKKKLQIAVKITTYHRGGCVFYSGDPRSQIFFGLKINPLAGICGEHFPMSENCSAVRVICSSHPGKGRLDATDTLRDRTQPRCREADAVLCSPWCHEPFSCFSRV